MLRMLLTLDAETYRNVGLLISGMETFSQPGGTIVVSIEPCRSLRELRQGNKPAT